MLTRYAAWANALFYATLAELPEAVMTQQRQIVFGSLLRTVNHVYAMDLVWQAHLQGRLHGLTTRNPANPPPFAQVQQSQEAFG